MIIVLSIRYYQSATTSQQANTALEQVQAITAAMDNLGIGAGSYAGINTAKLTDVLGSANMTTPTNEPITITSAGVTTYEISMPLTVAICTSVEAKLSANKNITNQACDGSGTLTYTYNSSTPP
jgi:hypothetical protein